MYKKRNVKSAPRKRRVLRKKSSKVSAPIKSYINRTIRRNEETKHTTNQYGLTNFNAGINSASDLITVLPVCTQGTGQNNRIGNKIRPIRLEITGYVVYQTNASQANADAKFIGGRLFCFQDKTSRAYSNNIYNYNLLNLGGTSSNFTGTALNWVAPHNNDQFRFFCDKKMKFLKPYGLTNNSVPSSTVAITGMDNSLFHPFKIVLTEKHLPALLSYDAADDGNFPTNFSPYISLGYADLLNYSPDVIPVQLAMEFNSTLYYKDA